MDYFAQFPIVEYNGLDLVDITRRVVFFTSFASSDFISSDYHIQDGETPQSIAQDFYGDPKLDWTILSCNNMLNPFYDWPMNVEQMNAWLSDTFINPDGVYLYVLPDGRQFFVDQASYLQSIGLLSTAAIYTIRDYQEAINDAKRKIRVIQPSQMSSVLNKYKNFLTQ